MLHILFTFHNLSRDGCEDAKITDEETEAPMLTEGAHLSSSPVSQGFGTLLEGNNPSSSLCTSGSLGGDSI